MAIHLSHVASTIEDTRPVVRFCVHFASLWGHDSVHHCLVDLLGHQSHPLASSQDVTRSVPTIAISPQFPHLTAGGGKGLSQRDGDECQELTECALCDLMRKLQQQVLSG